MPNKIETIAWDSCVIIDAIQRTGKYQEIAPLIGQGEKGTLKILVSEISIVECSHLKQSSLPLEEQHKLLDRWFESPYLVRQSVHPGIVRRAVRLSREFQLGAADAIVLATAEFRKVSVLHTGDGSGKKKGKKLLPLSGKIGNPPITISEPNSAPPGGLFLRT
jgi:predicted nucleic acid-binding protein